MRATRLSALLAAAVLASGSAQAVGIGEMVGVTCAGCHGTDGVSAGAAPSLKGVDAAYLTSAMMDFKTDKRPASIMNRIAKGYTDDQIKAVANYFGSMK